MSCWDANVYFTLAEGNHSIDRSFREEPTTLKLCQEILDAANFKVPSKYPFLF